MPRLHHRPEAPRSGRDWRRRDVDPPCPFCGAYAARCTTDREDGSTVCAMTGRTVLPAKENPS